MSESPISRERFDLLLPFYLNGTLEPDEQQRMYQYVQTHPEVEHALKFAEQLQRVVVADGQTAQPTQYRVDRLLARTWPQQYGAPDGGVVQPASFGWSWLMPFVSGMAVVLLVWGFQGVPTGSLHTDMLDGRADIRVALVPGVKANDPALLEQLQAFNSEVVGHEQIDGRNMVEIDLSRRSQQQHALIEALTASGQIDGHVLLASQ
ncbi:MAG TPA: hypothetical protein VIC30_10480 [Orrella sp.]